MAVARMQRVSVIGHTAVVHEVVERLQRAGVVEIARTELPDLELAAPLPEPEVVHSLEGLVADAQFVQQFLGRFHESEQAFATFISEKVHISESTYDELDADEAFMSLYEECTQISDRLGAIERERARLRDLVEQLSPWTDLRLQISAWKGTEHVVLFTGTVPTREGQAIRQALREAVEDVTVAEVGQADGHEAWVVMAHRCCVDEVRAALSLTRFQEVRFPGLNDYPAEESARAQAAIAALDAEERGLLELARELSAANYERSAALVQALLSRLDALEVRESFAATERTFLVTGWVPVRRKAELIEALAPIGGDVDVTFSDPEPDDAVPVELANPRIIQPFEVLTDLYGRPRYGDIDPTPLLAGFFFLFFGMCLGDAGYGLVLAVAAWYIKNKLDVAPAVRRFMDLLIAGGVAAVLVGVATRSYFAASEQALPAFLRYEPVLDPLNDIIVLLVVSVVIGVVHVTLGVLTNAYRSIRDGDWWSAVQDDLSSVMFVAAAIAVLRGAPVPVLLWALVIGVVLKGRILEKLVVQRSPLKAFLGVFSGLLGMYGMTGFLADFLSYTRLAALGLSGMLVGDVMNRLAGLVKGIPWGVGLVAAALILIAGHTFNLVINLLGSFVHPARLQFVEFFSKFYEGGGRPFVPFARRTKQLVLHPASGEREGGTRT